MRRNPLKKIYEKCNQGGSNDKLKNLPPFPTHIDIEITNHCNFMCLMCPTGNGSMKRNRGFMDQELFRKILKEIEVFKTPLRFIRWGEPTIHRELTKYIKLAKNKDIICHLNTNGFCLNAYKIDDLINSGLDSIKISFQGVDKKSYGEMRDSNFFDELVERVKLIHQRRGAKASPYIHVSTSATYETDVQIQNFRNKLENYADLVTIGKTVLDHVDADKTQLSSKKRQTLERLKKLQSVNKVHRECPEVFDKLSIDWDGKVTACCSDYDRHMVVGDIKEETLQEIWKSSKLNHYRKILAEMKHDKLKLCRFCYKIAP